MKFGTAIGTFLVLATAATTNLITPTDAFSPSLATNARTSAFVPSTRSFWKANHHKMAPVTKFTPTASALSMSFNVGIVGATGAVGAEIRSVLENRGFPVEKLRIFGSERSAGSTIATEKYGDIKVELFDVDKARECDVIFLAVSGDFALEHAEAISKGDDGAVVIDNSVSIFYLFLCVFLVGRFDFFTHFLFHTALLLFFTVRLSLPS